MNKYFYRASFFVSPGVGRVEGFGLIESTSADDAYSMIQQTILDKYEIKLTKEDEVFDFNVYAFSRV